MTGGEGKCPKCEKAIAPAATFCTRCGTRVATAAPPSRASSPTTQSTSSPRPMASSPSPAPVLSYQVPPKLEPVAKLPLPRSTSTYRPWVAIAILGVFAVKVLVLTHSGSRTSRSTSPQRYLAPPPRMPVTPAMPGNTPIVPNPNAPRQIPGTSLSIDQNGRVIVPQPTPAVPGVPAKPSSLDP